MSLADPLVSPETPRLMEFKPPGAAAPFLRVENVRKSFGSQIVLNDVSLDIVPGELVAILGPSGCGKTTLLRIIAGLERQDSGRILMQNRDVSKSPASSRGCGIVFQSYALFPNLTVEKNIAFGMNRRSFSRARRQARVIELLDLIGLPDIAGRYPAKLSGGQQQRVALARALAVNPALLLLDEPLSALDAKVRVRLRGEIRRIQETLKLTTILVTHDQEEALTMADRVVIMDHGSIRQAGAPAEVYNQPRDLRVADFLGTTNLLAGGIVETGNRVGFPEFKLMHLPCDAKLGSRVSIMFRPEHAALVSDADPAATNCLTASFERGEFRGPVTRLHLTVAGTPIVIDVSCQQSEEHLSSGRKELVIHLPPENLRVFDSEGVAV